MGGIASRMPVHVYPVISEVIKDELNGYDEFLNLSTKDSLIFGFSKRLNDTKHVFVIIQAARYSGRVSAETAVSRVNSYPYYISGSPLKIGTFGFRSKSCVLDDGTQFSLGYGINDMRKVIVNMIRDYAVPSLHSLLSSSDNAISMAENIWVPLYNDWYEAEKEALPKRSNQFPELKYEDICRKFLIENLFENNTYLRFLGPLRNRYESKRFFDCHLYLMASALEFLETPEIISKKEEANADSGKEKKRMITFYDLMGPIPVKEEKKLAFLNQSPALEDPILGILKRQEQDKALSLSDDPEQRKMEYAFLQSMSALEALSVMFNMK